MAKARVGNTARLPAVDDPNTQEAVRIIADRLGALEGESKLGVTDTIYDDTYLKNQIRYLQRELDEHNHRRRQAVSGGDTYASFFKATYSGSGSNIDIALGYSLFPGLTEIAAASVPITLTNGTHYVYMVVYNRSGTWYTVYVASPTIAYDSYDTIPFVIASVDVVDGAIDGDTIIQHQFGMIENPSANKGARYRGQFAAMPGIVGGDIFINTGKIITGTTTTTVAETTRSVSVTAATHYLYCQVYYSGGVVVAFNDSTTYPVNTDTTERFLIASYDADGSAITDIRQEIHGAFHSTRIYD